MSGSNERQIQQDIRYVRDEQDRLLDYYDKGLDAEAAMVSRRIIEKIISTYALIFAPAHFHASVYDKLRAIEDSGALSTDTIDALHGLRKIGNRAVHSHDSDPVTHDEISQQVIPVIGRLIDFWEEWIKNAGDLPDPEDISGDSEERSHDKGNNLSYHISPHYKPAVRFSPDTRGVSRVVAYGLEAGT